MLRDICVAWDDTPPARWAVDFAGVLARVCGSRVTIVHVTAPAETTLIDLGEAGRPRRTLSAAAASLPPELEVSERLLAGRPAEELAACGARSDLLIVGTRPLSGSQRLYAARLRHALLPEARCPVALVRRPFVTARRPYLVAGGLDAFALAGALALDLRATVLHTSLARAALACRRHRPLLAVVAAERSHGLRRRLGCSPTDAVVEAASCPVLIATRARAAPPV